MRPWSAAWQRHADAADAHAALAAAATVFAALLAVVAAERAGDGDAGTIEDGDAWNAPAKENAANR
ncbi:hypothetical protein ASF61_14330 [Duganella sp. Leaf126]|nr:hypothetical protein ASF61_14330 [Duganella sp. Leaf126]